MAPSEGHWANLSAIVFGAQDAIIGYRLDGTIASWNEAAERLFGYSESEALALSAEILIAGVRVMNFFGVMARIRQRELVAPYEDMFRCKDGRVVFASVAVSPVFDDTLQLLGISQIIRLVRRPLEPGPRHGDTESREMMAEFLHLSRLSTMGEMAAALAHELNQPLTAIAMYLIAAQRVLQNYKGSDGPVLATAMENALQQAKRAAQITRHLKSFVSKDDIKRQPVLISNIIREAGELAAILGRQSGVAMDYELDADAAVLADRVQVQQVLFNLMRNAIEAMTHSPSRKLRTSTTRRKDHIVISISDTGPGISAEVESKLFQPFTTTKPDGMGWELVFQSADGLLARMLAKFG